MLEPTSFARQSFNELIHKIHNFMYNTQQFNGKEGSILMYNIVTYSLLNFVNYFFILLIKFRVIYIIHCMRCVKGMLKSLFVIIISFKFLEPTTTNKYYAVRCEPVGTWIKVKWVRQQLSILTFSMLHGTKF